LCNDFQTTKGAGSLAMGTANLKKAAAAVAIVLLTWLADCDGPSRGPPQRVDIVYNKPDSLRLGRTTEMSLVIKTKYGQDISAEIKGLPGTLQEKTIDATEEMSARLSAPDVEITLQGDEKRAVTPRAPVQWIWHVKPKAPGKTTLTLEVFGYIPVDKKKREFVKIRTFRDEIEVTSTWLEQAGEYVKSIEPMRASLFATVGGLVAGVTWLVARLRRRKTEDENS
jgi:hypothetical protein